MYRETFIILYTIGSQASCKCCSKQDGDLGEVKALRHQENQWCKFQPKSKSKGRDRCLRLKTGRE